MVLIIHILIALSSIGFTGLTYASPSASRLKVSYGFIAATLISGFLLVVTTGSPILRSCLTGLGYLAIVMYATLAARRKLARARVDI